MQLFPVQCMAFLPRGSCTQSFLHGTSHHPACSSCGHLDGPQRAPSAASARPGLLSWCSLGSLPCLNLFYPILRPPTVGLYSQREFSDRLSTISELIHKKHPDKFPPARYSGKIKSNENASLYFSFNFQQTVSGINYSYSVNVREGNFVD